MKRVITITIALVLLLTLTACGSSETPSNSDESTAVSATVTTQASDGTVDLLESGYTTKNLDGDVYLYWGAKVKNSSTTNAFEFHKIYITAKDAAGNVLATEEQVLGKIQPGEEQAFGSSIDCNGQEPAAVEFSVGEGTRISPDATALKSSDFAINGINERVGEYGEVSYTGTVKNNGQKNTSDVGIVVLLKNQGQIVFGTVTFVDDVAAGQERPFEVSDYDVPAHDSYEIYALDWGME